MLFITNRTPKQSSRSKKSGTRKISFDYNNTSVSQNLYFCQRNSKDDYDEILSKEFFKQLKAIDSDNSKGTQILFYIHGFNNNMEPEVFSNAQALQAELDQIEKDMVVVIPLIWPCDNDSVTAFIDDYWDDQRAADASGPAFARALGKFDNWRRAKEQQDIPCLKRLNVLAHSMGNRVLKNALHDWAVRDFGGEIPQIFRNIFMVAADVKNECLEEDQDGRYIVDATRNLIVYYASDDYAMPSSKVANIKNKTLSRRMGMTGPEDLSKLPKKVYEVDCDDFNNRFEFPMGHGYYLNDGKGNTSPVIPHIAAAIDTGRVQPNERSYRLKW